MAHRVKGFLEKNKIPRNGENGFWPERSCLDHIFILNDLLRIRRAEKEETFSSVIDFQKAFDYVSHEYLMHKLSTNGIIGHTFYVIKTMYITPVSCVNVGGSLSGWFPVQAGIRQGALLPPILFLLFINDFANDITDLRVGVDTPYCQISLLLYADDTVLLSPTYVKAQQMLDVMGTWCHKWGMKVNIAKSEVVHARTKRHPQCLSVWNQRH